MKRLLLIFAVALCYVSCISTEKLPEKQDSIQDSKVIANDTLKISNHELEHDIIIIEPGYNSWLASQAKPKGFYNQMYLENNNLRYVREWNARVLQPQKFSANLYEAQIFYNQNVNYGYDVNYKLFNYFVYFQNRYKQNLLGGRIPTN